MYKFKSFADFGNAFNEAEAFDTRTEKDPAALEKGDQVFHAGKWQQITEVRPDTFAITDDNNRVSVVKMSDIESRGILVKMATPEDNAAGKDETSTDSQTKLFSHDL